MAIHAHGGEGQFGEYIFTDEIKDPDQTSNRISVGDLTKVFKNSLISTNNILILSTCHAGMAINPPPKDGLTPACFSPFYLNNLSLSLNTSIIAACKADQLSTMEFEATLEFGLVGRKIFALPPEKASIAHNYYIIPRYDYTDMKVIRLEDTADWIHEFFWLGTHVFSSTFSFLFEKMPDYHPMTAIRIPDKDIPLYCRHGE